MKIISFREWLDNQILFYKRDREQYGFLSNFYMAQFKLDGYTWPSVEHYYMAAKSDDPAYKEAIRSAPTPGKAKRIGDDKDKPKKGQSWFRKGRATLHPNWDNMKLEVMRRAVYAKFSQNPTLRQALLDTKDAELIEDSPTDHFWGSGASGTGKNWLGKILMDVRKLL
jgi:ribA/ribD-fused uncharacterized protein